MPERNWLQSAAAGGLLLLMFVFVEPCIQPPPNPINSRLIGGRITCDNGYELFGEALPACNENNEWILPICLKRTELTEEYINLSTVNKSSSCRSTLLEPSPWIKLDLQSPIDVHYVQLTLEGPPSFDIELRVGNNSIGPARNPLCHWEPSSTDKELLKKFKCARPLQGQFIYIQLVGEGVLSTCGGISFYSSHDPSRCLSSSNQVDNVLIHNSTCYSIHPSPLLNQNQSVQQCLSYNSTLLNHLPPTPLLSKLTSLKPTLKKQLFWLQAQRDSTFTSRTWRWSDSNIIIKKPPWGPNQPNNYNGEQNCVVLDGMRDWGWNDVGCGLEFGFVCSSGVVSCGSVDVNQGSRVVHGKDVYSVGDVVSFECANEGYYLKGDKERVCKGTEGWSGSSPTCNFVDCGPLNSTLANGSVAKPNRTTFGAVHKYVCNENHTLVGSKERRCLETGAWSGSQVMCLYASCPQPPPLTNGTLSVNGLKVNSIASYSCNQGSVLEGEKTRVCQLGGVWSGGEPTCKFIQCQELERIQNGELDASVGKLNEIRKIKCSEGYALVGEDYVCNDKGAWSGGGSCEVVTCPEPEVPPGSIVTGYEFNYGSIINYSCEEGHLLRGLNARRCLSTGLWSGAVPECEYINCGHAPPAPYSQLRYVNSSTHLNSIVIYACSRHYQLKGPNKRVCESNGRWSHPGPACEEVRCPAPSLPAKSTISSKGNDRGAGGQYFNSNGVSSFRVGSIIKYHCERGYKLVSDGETQTCQNDGVWSPELKVSCTFVDCGEPPGLLNGYYKTPSNSTFLGSNLLYSCENGYKLTGRERHICSEQGRWEPGLVNTSCSQITCPALPYLSASCYSVGTVAKITCPEGHKLIGKNTATCNEDGIWTGTSNCQVSLCEEFNPIQNARIFNLNNSLIHGSLIEVHCMPGYVRSGPATINCLNGVWQGSVKCTLLQESGQDQSQETSTAVIVSVVLLSLGLVIGAAMGFVFWKRKKRKLNKGTRGVQEEPGVVFTQTSASPLSSNQQAGTQQHYQNVNQNVQQPQHYYDNPSQEHIYEDLPGPPRSYVTINGVAV